MEMEELHAVIDSMAERWPSPIVARRKIEIFTGGLLNGKTIANHEAKGEGPPKLKMGRIAGYPVDTLIEWLKEKIYPVAPRKPRVYGKRK